MPGPEIATFRSAIDAFNRWDLETIASYFDRDSELDWSRSIGPSKSVYRGSEEILKFWEEFAGAFEHVHMEIEDVVDTGGQLVAAILSRMRGRDGIEVTARNAWVVVIREGKLRRLEMFQTHAEALDAAGVRE